MCGSDAMDSECRTSDLSTRRPLVFLAQPFFGSAEPTPGFLTSEADRALYTAWARAGDSTTFGCPHSQATIAPKMKFSLTTSQKCTQRTASGK